VSTEFLQVVGHRLEYEVIRAPGADTGTENRPVLVFLHEGLGSLAMWKAFPRAVVDATGCDALVYSRYGHGKSARLAEPRAADYMHREALEALPELLAALGIARPVLIGHSDGASIALIYAGARRPVRGLVLLAPHVFVEDLTVASIARVKTAFETTDISSKLARYHDDAVGTFWGWNDIWLSPAFRAWNIEEYLPFIDVPTLLVQGEDDEYGTLAQIESIARHVKGPVEKVVLARCGHSPQVDQKAATLHAVSTFVVRQLEPELDRGR